MVLMTLEEIFIKIADEEEKDRLFSYQEKRFRSWDPCWGSREILPSPISGVLEGKCPFMPPDRLETLTMRTSYLASVGFGFCVDFLCKEYSKENTEKSGKENDLRSDDDLEDPFRDLIKALENEPLARRIMFCDNYKACLQAPEYKVYAECIRAFHKEYENYLLDPDSCKDKIWQSFWLWPVRRCNFSWPGAKALYLPPKEKTLLEEKYKRIMSRLRTEYSRSSRDWIGVVS